MKIVDQARWPRKEIFNFFKMMDSPHVNICAEVELGPLVEAVKSSGRSLSRAILYIVTHAANSIPELRHRIRGDEVVEHEAVHPSITVLTENKLFSFCEVKYSPDPAEFMDRAEEAMARAARAPSLNLSDEPGRDDYLFVSSLPWIRFSSISHPINYDPVDSVPRISWGRAETQGDRTRLPLALQVHHALADGYHLGLFYSRVEDLIAGAGDWPA